MLASSIYESVYAIYNDYTGLNISTVLDQAINLASSRGSIDPNSYSASYNSIRTTLNEIIYKNSFDRLPDYQKDIFNKSSYKDLIPRKIAERLITSLDPDIISITPSSEIAVFKDYSNEMLRNFAGAIRTMASLQIEPYKSSDEQVRISFELPRIIFHDDVGDLGERLQKFDMFFSAICELTNNPNRKPQILSISTSDLLTILVAHADEAVAIFKFIAAFTDVAIKQIGLYSAIKTMRQSGIPEEQLKPAEDGFDAVSQKMIKDAIEKTIKDIRGEENIRPEISMKFTRVSSFLVNDIAQGAVIKIERNDSYQIEILTNTTEPQSPEKIEALLSEQRQLQAKLDTIKLPGELLLLPGPKDKKDEIQ